MPDVIVVGAGAAGILAAWRAAGLGGRVVLLEKTSRIGTKILISGGGKCNITHAGPLEDVLKAFRPNEARFLRPSFYRFPNIRIVEMLTERGLNVYTRPDGRIFPVDQTAKDVVRILRTYLDDARVDVRLDTPVTKILALDGAIRGVETPHGRIEAKRLIVATGGSSYPNSGTTGDAWPWARALGHSVVKVRAALAPMYLEMSPEQTDWAGVALREIVLKARLVPAAGKTEEIARWKGDLLFTHHGVSGPTVLGVSRIVAERLADGAIHLEVDLVPDRNQEEVAADLLRQVTDSPRKLVAAALAPLVPSRLVDPVLASAGVPPETPGARLDRKGRNRLAETLKRWPIGQVRAVPLEKGEVVAGGISLDEVDPQTLRSRKVEGLYFCGEVLDIAGPVGGYNLQAAFATGFVAGEDAIRRND